MVENQEIDLTFKQFFEVGQFWWWYTPLNSYRRFSNPLTGTPYLLSRALYYFVLASLILLSVLDIVFIVDSISSGGAVVQWITVIVWFVCVMNAYQTTIFTWNRGPQIVELLNYLHDNFPKSDAEKNRIDAQGIAKNFVEKSILYKTLFFIAFTGMCTTPILLCVIGYFTKGVIVLELPLVLWLPFDPLVMPWYPFIYLLELWFFSLETFCIIGNATFLGAITMVIGIQFKVLALDARTMDFRGDLTHDFKVIESVIKQHNRVLYGSKKARDMFSFQLLVAYAIASLVICIFMFLIHIEDEIVVSMIYFLVLLCYLNYSSMYAIIGNVFIESSLAISDAVYDSNWTITDVRVQKLIVLIIQRANVPEVLSGMGFFEASFPTMSKIMTTSYSYFTLLRTTFQN